MNICEEMLGTSFRCYSADMERDKILLVINIKDHQSGEKEHFIIQFLKQVQQETAKIMENTISIGIGNTYSGMENVRLSFAEALEAVSYRHVAGHGAILLCAITAFNCVFYIEITSKTKKAKKIQIKTLYLF